MPSSCDGTVAATYSQGDSGRSCEGPVALGLAVDGALAGNVECTSGDAKSPMFSGPVAGTVGADGSVNALWVVTGVAECGPFDMELHGTIAVGAAAITFGWNDVAGSVNAALQ